MFRWYVINTYSGHENKVKQNLEHRVHTMGQERNVRQVVVPTEQISEMKDGQKVQTEKRTMPGYVLVNMEMTDDAWGPVKNTPGVPLTTVQASSFRSMLTRTYPGSTRFSVWTFWPSLVSTTCSVGTTTRRKRVCCAIESIRCSRFVLTLFSCPE